MENLTNRICWELVKKEGYIAIWRKPLDNSCYINRDPGAQPPICDEEDDPNSLWYLLCFSACTVAYEKKRFLEIVIILVMFHVKDAIIFKL